MKKIIFVALVSLLSQVAFAQHKTNEYDRITNLLLYQFNYPIELIHNCKPTACLLKIETDANKRVINMQLSDSADSLLKEEFEKRFKVVDKTPLEEYLKREYAKSSSNTYLIPLTFTLYLCPDQVVSMSVLVNKYYQFNSKPIIGPVTILNALERQLKIEN